MSNKDVIFLVQQVKGLEWEGAAIGNAVWGGVLLRDVLAAAGLEGDDPNVEHIQVGGLFTSFIMNQPTTLLRQSLLSWFSPINNGASKY